MRPWAARHVRVGGQRLGSVDIVRSQMQLSVSRAIDDQWLKLHDSPSDINRRLSRSVHYYETDPLKDGIATARFDQRGRTHPEVAGVCTEAQAGRGAGLAEVASRSRAGRYLHGAGHILTGLLPQEHGIVGNGWLFRETGKFGSGNNRMRSSRPSRSM